jgi:hypothetical protein
VNECVVVDARHLGRLRTQIEQPCRPRTAVLKLADVRVAVEAEADDAPEPGPPSLAVELGVSRRRC